MAQLTLYVNTSNNSLVAGRASTQAVDAGSLPFFYGDTLSLIIYLLQLPAGYNAQDPANSTLQTVSTAGLQLSVWIDDGTNGGTVYTDQIAFDTDAGNTYFFADLPLNTVALATLLGSSQSKTAYLQIGYVQAGKQTTVLTRVVNIGVGIPNVTQAVAPGLTPLSAEAANAAYFPKNPVPGLPIYLESLNGKILALMAVDNPDGTASLQANPIN